MATTEAWSRAGPWFSSVVSGVWISRVVSPTLAASPQFRCSRFMSSQGLPGVSMENWRWEEEKTS
jgi:hypothetical protein